MLTSEDLYGDSYDDDLDQGPLEDAEAVDVPENADEEDQPKEVVKPKRVVRNPRPKLNAETLKGKRGLTALESYFDRVNFKGKGHEEQDLNVILKTYEYWCHRLFPKYPFDECIAKIEKLGSKKAVQTHIKKMRLDMIFDEEQEPNLLDENEDSDDDQNDGNIVQDQFDDLLNIPPAPVTTEITDEQAEQIRINREKAEKLRRERIQRKLALVSDSQNSIQGGPGTSQTNDLLVSQNLTQGTEVESQENFQTNASTFSSHEVDDDLVVSQYEGGESQSLTHESEVGSQESHAQEVDIRANSSALSLKENNDLAVSQSEPVISQNLTDESEVESQEENHDQDVDTTSKFQTLSSSLKESNGLSVSQNSTDGETRISQNLTQESADVDIAFAIPEDNHSASTTALLNNEKVMESEIGNEDQTNN